MTRFLTEMQQSAEHARQEAARGVREWSDTLRETTLLNLGDAVFGELTTRSVSDLRRQARDVQAATLGAWADSDAKRAKHEQTLSPGLSNPNAEKKLRELIESEASRHKTAIVLAKEDRSRMAECLRERGDAFVKRLSARFEAAIRLIDALPLHSHFGTLPGDEAVEPPRMSIKRRMRHLQNNTSVDQWGDGLPERQWMGIPRHELRAELRGSEWPVDSELADATPEMLAELTPTLASFRSPVHRTLFERRNFYYDRYRQEFVAEVRQRSAEFAAREENEQVGQRNWQSMVKQLNGDVSSVEVDDPEEKADADESAAPAPAANPKAAPAPKGAAAPKAAPKGKK